jgi:ketosteroid isomerase-like protein
MEVAMEADIVAIKEVLNQYAVSINNGDFEHWMSLWADGGVQMAPNAPALSGKVQIRDGNKPAFDQMNFDISINTVDGAEIHGDLGLTRCTYSLKLTPKVGGETIDLMPEGKALTLYGKQADGSWKIVYDCFNSNVPEKQE